MVARLVGAERTAAKDRSNTLNVHRAVVAVGLFLVTTGSSAAERRRIRARADPVRVQSTPDLDVGHVAKDDCGSIR